MKINQIKQIDSMKGPWLVVVDHGSEGLSLYSQHESAQDAVDAIARGVYNPAAVLYLPNIHCQDFMPEESR